MAVEVNPDQMDCPDLLAVLVRKVVPVAQDRRVRREVEDYLVVPGLLADVDLPDLPDLLVVPGPIGGCWV